MDIQVLISLVAAIVWLAVEASKKIEKPLPLDKEQIALALTIGLSIGLAAHGDIEASEAGIAGFVGLVMARLFHDGVQNPLLGKTRLHSPP